MALNALAAFKIGDGTRHLQDTAVGTGRETEPFHRQTEHLKTLVIGLSKLVDHTLRHLGIAIDTLHPFVSFLLNPASLDNTLADLLTRLTLLHLGELLERYHRHFAMNIDTIKHRTADLGEITTDLTWRTGAVMRRIPVVTTGARIHRGDEHKGTGIFHRVFRTADSNLAVFQWLAEHFEGTLVELRELIEKEESVMREGHFPRMRLVGATGQGYL